MVRELPTLLMRSARADASSYLSRWSLITSSSRMKKGASFSFCAALAALLAGRASSWAPVVSLDLAYVPQKTVGQYPPRDPRKK